MFECIICGQIECRCLKRRSGMEIKSDALPAKIFIAIDAELRRHGYSMMIADNVSIATLPSGAIVVYHPERKPIAILINPIDLYRP